MNTMTAGYDQTTWESFAVAEVGAAAALAGLLVVACSINIREILQMPPVVSRLAGSLSLFIGVLMAGTILLVPAQDHRLAGGELAVAGLVVAGVVLRHHGVHRDRPEYRRHALGMAVLTVISPLLITTAGVCYAVGIGGGLYWLFPGTLLAFAVGLFNAWVALVEILR
ncbi:hypothetical protein [Nocardia vaccinii]|uniref:hypothetical protein n=1 Tax=Nocardia vaccinii TaxID=1822 RepID=UPI000A9A5C55|nr:hypothetical protein [Nocardia vaccinii]